ncbi:ATP-dependent zinc metalloprotease FtsH [Carboxydochorda subterranea]|uniref:ATP-dependent zinc metalloprotease FtsH n=1 Tax=Carboxydichorda subterranea TaxID=3109565 RepID=A0ABZ1BWC5_9FIRM|nr:ATP-dependent zinc metalloprotease FtsH [Limnochorda sp. L945t]WRP16986.1 ATP-dependent zinc metalloprotease FtsH [Limnochorda sp. L945t]
MNRFLRGVMLYLLIAIVLVSIVSTFYSPSESKRQIEYYQFTRLLDSGQVASVRFVGDQRLEGTLKDNTSFSTYIPAGSTQEVMRNLEAKGVAISAEPPPNPPWWLNLLPNLLMLVVFVGIWLFILNQMQGGSNRAMSFGKSRARLHTEEKTKVTFNDVAGLDEAKQELQEVVEFLKHPKKFVDIGARVPKGILLVGPPGTGKTLLARAVAGEAGVPFFSISGSDFVEMFVGVGAARVRDLFETAKKNSPCIVFIDELDAVGRQRGAGLGGGHDEREQTLNQLLVEMDGFEPNSGIIIMAATNRPDVLDPALLRPGRFDRKVVVDRPDVEGRYEILRVHSRNKPLAPDVDLKLLARRTPGFVGADLENVMNEAAILAARRGKKRITMDECEEAIDRVIMGPERRHKVIRPQDKKVLAYHEAGHALVAHFLPHSDPVHKVTIVGRGLAGGYTMVLPDEDRMVETRSELLDRLAHILGGRAAEQLAFSEISTGAQNDLEQATKLARQMVMAWGMSEKLGPLTFGRQHEDLIFLGRDIARDRNYSEQVAAAIDDEVRRLIEEAYSKAATILKDHRDALERVVEALMEKETLNREAFVATVEGRELPAEAPAPSAPAASPEARSAAGAERPRRALDKDGLLEPPGKQPRPAEG